jgi:hypothetical protein
LQKFVLVTQINLDERRADLVQCASWSSSERPATLTALTTKRLRLQTVPTVSRRDRLLDRGSPATDTRSLRCPEAQVPRHTSLQILSVDTNVRSDHRRSSTDPRKTSEPRVHTERECRREVLAGIVRGEVRGRKPASSRVCGETMPMPSGWVPCPVGWQVSMAVGICWHRQGSPDVADSLVDRSPAADIRLSATREADEPVFGDAPASSLSKLGLIRALRWRTEPSQSAVAGMRTVRDRHGRLASRTRTVGEPRMRDRCGLRTAKSD